MTLKLGAYRARPYGRAPQALRAAWLALLLSGCLAPESAGPAPGMMALLPPQLDAQGAVQSVVIGELQSRESILPPGSSYAVLADHLLAASALSAEAALRMKRLTAQARAKNWLPKLGSDLSLSALGRVVAQLVLEQAVFDQGLRRAERDFAAADVEVAAVALAQDVNRRIYAGLKLYIEADRAAVQAGIIDTALTRMAEFERIMAIRVEGGVSDRSEQRVLVQKRAEMQASLSATREARQTALAELQILLSEPMPALAGLTILPEDSGGPMALAVLLAQGEAARSIAEIAVARARMAPGLGLSAGLDRSGDLDAGLNISGDFLDLARGETLQALTEAEALALRKLAEAERDSAAKLVALGREIAELRGQKASESKVLAEMEANLPLFWAQYKAGRISLLELANHFEALVALRRSHGSLEHQIALARLEMALLRGQLVAGAAL